MVGEGRVRQLGLLLACWPSPFLPRQDAEARGHQGALEELVKTNMSRSCSASSRSTATGTRSMTGSFEGVSALSKEARAVHPPRRAHLAAPGRGRGGARAREGGPREAQGGVRRLGLPQGRQEPARAARRGPARINALAISLQAGPVGGGRPVLGRRDDAGRGPSSSCRGSRSTRSSGAAPWWPADRREYPDAR